MILFLGCKKGQCTKKLKSLIEEHESRSYKVTDMNLAAEHSYWPPDFKTSTEDESRTPQNQNSAKTRKQVDYRLIIIHAYKPYVTIKIIEDKLQKEFAFRIMLK